ncbi:MAG: Gfo/Idh/MocA family oxidoreductase [Sphingomonadales bacterium]|nr:Gfo/Idh/MocA family oxidoreductase [Sphingomonadales bacterium]
MMRIGLLGASRIAPRAIIQPAANHPDAVITAVGARDLSKAEAYAAEHGIPAAVGSYQALVEREDVDLVYCGLPPSVHLDTCRAASAAGKMLLIEKPFAFDAASARAIVAAADAAGRSALEAYHYRFHSLFGRAEALVKDGAIGRVMRARGEFEADIKRVPGELRWMPETGGGGTMDLGCYVLHAFRTLLGEGEVLTARSDQLDGVDATLEANLRFGEVQAWMRCSMLAPRNDWIEIEGTDGILRMNRFVSPHYGGTLVLTTQKGTITEEPTGLSTYAAQLDHAVRVFRGEADPLTGGADAIATMELIDTCRTRGREGAAA